MGSGESTTRKVSFGVDEEDRVRILRGVKLSEDVLQRMRGVANIPPERTPSPTPTPTNAQRDPGASPSRTPTARPQPSPQPRAQSSTKTTTSTSKPAAYAKDEQKRYERHQTILKEELAKVARKEREAARDEVTKALSRERQHTRQEVEKAKQLSADEVEVVAQQLQKKDAELNALDAFYKEQLAQLEKRNMERYKQSSEQFHQAASMTEANVRPRSTEPVCPGLQVQILSCYKENREETLRCSDLAKEYMQCINAAKKNLLVNHG